MTQPHRTPAWRGTSIAIAAAGLLVLAISSALYARLDDVSDRPGRPPLPVSLIAYQAQDSYLREQRFLGLVQAGMHSDVGFEIAGTIASLAVREGDAVAAGDVLATLDQQTLRARRGAAASRVAQMETELELAAGRARRQAPLANSGAISAQAFDDTRLAEKTAAARLAAASAELRALEIELAKSVLRAPYDALVGRQHLDAGAVTRPGAALFTLIASTEREAHIGIAVEQAGTVRAGERYPLVWRGEQLQATLRSVRPDVNPVSMTTVAIFELPGQIDAYDGEPVAVALPRRIAAPGGWLPMSALLEGERGTWTVLRVRDDGQALHSVREVVEVLHVSGARAYVRGTLNDGDLVIADGVHRVAPGTRVRRAEI